MSRPSSFSICFAETLLGASVITNTRAVSAPEAVRIFVQVPLHNSSAIGISLSTVLKVPVVFSFALFCLSWVGAQKADKWRTNEDKTEYLVIITMGNTPTPRIILHLALLDLFPTSEICLFSVNFTKLFC